MEKQENKAALDSPESKQVWVTPRIAELESRSAAGAKNLFGAESITLSEVGPS